MEIADWSDREISQTLQQIAVALDSRGHEPSLAIPEHRRAVIVHQLLAGREADEHHLNYDLTGWHVGIVMSGPASPKYLDDLKRNLGFQMLFTRMPDTVWVWFGASRPLKALDLQALTALEPPQGLSLACGEPARGRKGWRLTHRQAKAALPVAQQSPRAVAHYSDVALVASAVNDELLATCLRQLYLAPLEQGKDGGRLAKQTLRAYFAAGRNVSSAAASLGVNRATVRNRLVAIEERLERSPDTFSAEFEVALCLDELAPGDN